jgi:hypothetical protein
MRRGSKLAIFAIVALAGSLSGEVSGQQTRLVLFDDRGKPLDDSVNVCFIPGARDDCREIAAGASVGLPAVFTALRIEGNGHGPLTLYGDALTRRAGGILSLTVPRKAWLIVEAPGRQEPLTVSLYLADDASLREPSFRAKITAGSSQIRIPSGHFIASLSMGRNAPDLHRLDAAPEAKMRVVYSQRAGWSLVARFRGSGNTRLSAGIRASLVSALGYETAPQLLREATSAADGVALFSGISVPMVSIRAKSSGFLDTETPGVVASEGSFALQDVKLLRGGVLRAVVSVDGQPQVKATCALAALSVSGGEPYRDVWQGSTGSDGVCESKPLPATGYMLTVRPSKTGARELRWIQLSEAQVTDESVAFHPTRLVGQVKRGENGQPGYSVESRRVEINWPADLQVDADGDARTNEDGHYELQLLTPGRYFVSLKSPAGTPVGGHKELSTWGDEEKELDFDLRAGSLQGSVMNSDGAPLPQAAVVLSGRHGALIAQTDDGGRFDLETSEDGLVNLYAKKVGYRKSDSVSIDVAIANSSVPAAPITFVLKKADSFDGTVVGTGGAPVAGAVVSSVVATGTMAQVFATSRSQSDGSFEISVPPGTPRFFISGPGCPLSFFVAQSPQENSADGAGPGGNAELQCPMEPSALEFSLNDENGRPVVGAGVILRTGGMVVPRSVLETHLAMLGLANNTDSSGHMIVPWLSPGAYDLFLNSSASEATIGAGYRSGFLSSVTLSPLNAVELQLTYLPVTP